MNMKPHFWYDKSHNYHSGDDMHPENPERVREIVKHLLQTMKGQLTWVVMNYNRGTVIDDEPNVLDIEPPAETYNTELEGRIEWHKATDGDTYHTKYTRIICERGIHMLSQAAEMIAYKGLQCGFIAIRPPGHHVGMNTGSRGFCHLNNVWLTVEEFYKRRIRNVAILDWDVHHGDGTENCVRECIRRMPTIRFVSMHAYGRDIYPGTGADSEDANVLNIALPKGTKATEYLHAFRTRAIPYLGKPDVLIVSAGYDAHFSDPMQYMKLRSGTYGIMSAVLKETIGCPVLFILEGGYCPEALAESVGETLKPWVTE